MKNTYTITSNTKIAAGVFRMELAGDTSLFKRPGQFVNIALDGFYLRRPISVCDWNDEGFTIVYKVFGDGTEHMSTLPCGAQLDILVGLGNGFDVDKAGDRPLLVGGGVGVPPLYGLAKQLGVRSVESGVEKPTVLLGFRTPEDVFYVDEFEALGCEVHVFLSSEGKRVTDFAGLKERDAEGVVPYGFSYFYACGPDGMLKALAQTLPMDGELSFEERMPCGFGLCMSCTCRTKSGAIKLCCQGPVIPKGEVLVEE
ncbi:MAG: dihydroorotate dehydrogenase electron transfer subunit [Oscillospiraceae bacterium]|nr:dihydroorotate dehydrogenase electron transfer subunit [Oscillospiraceae bacterium]